MIVTLIDSRNNPVIIKLKIEKLVETEEFSILWEDPISRNIRYLDKIHIKEDGDYYFTINKDVSFFENGIVFKLISIKNHTCIYSYEFKNLSFISGKNVFYISQNNYSGYSYAARNYIYQLLKSGYNVQWSDTFGKREYLPTNDEERLVFKCLDNKLTDFSSVIVHHTPDGWPSIAEKIPRGKKIYGLTTWETTRLHKSWVDMINSSVDEVIVPSNFNAESFRESGVYKKINVWRHDIFSFDNNTNFDELCEKFLLLENDKFIKDSSRIGDILKNKTVYYNISQFVNRKNISQLIYTFCKKFDKKDNVCLFIKTYITSFSQSEINILKYKMIEYTKHFSNLPNIIFCFDNLNNSEIDCIHKFSDVYFTLNRGEGFGLCTYTAKKIGNKIICGKFGAEKEFLDDHDILLDYTLGSSDNLDDFNKYYLGNNQQCAFYDSEYVISKLNYFPKTIK